MMFYSNGKPHHELRWEFPSPAVRETVGLSFSAILGAAPQYTDLGNYLSCALVLPWFLSLTFGDTFTFSSIA